MEESWKTRMGIPTAPPPTRHNLPNYPFRRSTGDRRKPISDEEPLSTDDFTDVFGGPPRTILSRQFFTGFPRSSSSENFSYEEIFWAPSTAVPFVRRGGRSLPEFRIPRQARRSADDHLHHQHRRESNGFYTTIFGCDDHDSVAMARSKSRSKASDSDRTGGDEDVYSNLRPMNVGSEWFSGQRQQNTTPFSDPNNTHKYNTEKDCNDNMEKYTFEFSGSKQSPEIISQEPLSNNSFRVSGDDLELDSPSSPVCLSEWDREQRTPDIDGEILRPYPMEQEEDDDDDAMTSSYVIEINSDYRETACESNGVDEAIAWAKEKFQTHNSECGKERESKEMINEHQLSDNFGLQPEEKMEILDEKIMRWSTGKEADIRLLLSSLHTILWHNSGWLMIPLWNIMEIPQVRKAYQKACLCLHPDKLQQRGATASQKYVAEKAFAVLQDAWAAFIARDVLKNC